MKKIFFAILLLSALLSLQAQSYTEMLNNSNAMTYSISVTGAVKNPGVYQLPITARVSMAITLSNTLEDTLNAAQQTILNPSNRKIILKRADEIRQLDLARFFILGDLEQNPFLQDGDVIVVQTVKDYIHIHGNLGSEIYDDQIRMELIPGDRITDILELNYGIINGLDPENCEVVRFDENSSELISINFSAEEIIKNPDSEQNITLQAGDRIYLRQIPNYQVKRYITIEGEVKYPGEYAIELGKTTLSQIIKKAGGPTAMADLHKSYIFRLTTEDVTHTEFESLRRTPALDLSTAEYRYLKEMYAVNRDIVTENFSDILSENSKNDVILKDADKIFISAKSTVVAVNGEIRSPGLYSFVEGMTYKDYIEQAGGTIKRANEVKIRIIRGDSGEWINPSRNTKIFAGDTIYVPRHERFSYYWPYIKETVAFVTGLATSIVVIQGLLN